MKKYLLSGFLIITFIAYVIHQRSLGEDVLPPASPSTVIEATPSPSAAPTTSAEHETTNSRENSDDHSEAPASPSPVASASPSPSTSVVTGKFKDGEYTGDSVDAFYGNVQVKAVIQGGKLTDVQFLDYPQDRRTSVEINSMAMPQLRTEAIQAQSAQVDIVSGATQTSRGFQASLQSALQKAQ